MKSLIGFLAVFNRVRMKIRRFSVELLPGRGALTLDIGSGDGPSVSADVLCDRYIADDAERTAPLNIDRPFVLGDLRQLPFRDQAFDFVYCKHVLEHMPQPEVAIRELERIAKAGYVEVPSEYLERASRSTPSHLWFVNLKDGVLVFTPKQEGILSDNVNEMYYDHLIDKDPYYTAYYYAHYFTHFMKRIVWKGRIPHRVENMASQKGEGFIKGQENATVDELERLRAAIDRARASAASKRSLKQRMKRLVKTLFRLYFSSGKNFRLIDLLACPVCRGAMEEDSRPEHVRCRGCQRVFPVLNGVPCLLPGAEITAEPALASRSGERVS